MMTQHSSLKSGSGEGAFRSVLKRFEKIKELFEKDKWSEEDSVYHLPKVKRIKFKIKKAKAAEEEAAAAEGAVPAEGAEGAAPAKEGAAPAKEGAAKEGAAKEGAAKPGKKEK